MKIAIDVLKFTTSAVYRLKIQTSEKIFLPLFYHIDPHYVKEICFSYNLNTRRFMNYFFLLFYI